VLFFTRQTAAVLRSHIAGFLANYIQPMVKRVSLWRRIKALIHALIDVMPKRVDSPVDLIHAMNRFHMRIWARGCFLDDVDLPRRLDHARCQRSRQRNANQRTGATCFECKHGTSPLSGF
jgi:hypothetical protein